jgi:hypothetical protein
MDVRVEIDPVAECLDGRNHSGHELACGESLKIADQGLEGQAAE